MPFVLIALASLGSCGDETVVNSVAGNKEVVFTSAYVEFSQIPITGVQRNSSSDFYGQRSDSGNYQEVSSYSSMILPKDSNSIQLSGDTIIISRFDSSGSYTSGPYSGVYSSSKSTNRTSFRFRIDTNTKTLQNCDFKNEIYNSSTNNNSSFSYSSSGTSSITQFTLQRAVEIIRTDSSYTAVIKPLQTQDIGNFVYKRGSGSNGREGGNASYYSRSETKSFKEFLPFTDQSELRIVIKYRYK